jgi:hypothetical protein
MGFTRVAESNLGVDDLGISAKTIPPERVAQDSNIGRADLVLFFRERATERG